MAAQCVNSYVEVREYLTIIWLTVLRFARILTLKMIKKSWNEIGFLVSLNENDAFWEQLVIFAISSSYCMLSTQTYCIYTHVSIYIFHIFNTLYWQNLFTRIMRHMLFLTYNIKRIIIYQFLTANKWEATTTKPWTDIHPIAKVRIQLRIYVKSTQA